MALFDSSMTNSSAVEAWCKVALLGKTSDTKSLDECEKACVKALNWLIISIKKGTTSTIQGLLRENLGPYLTSEEPTVRARAIELLATLLERLPTLKLQDNVGYSTACFQKPSLPHP
jgi:hypothetical protein